MNANREEPAGKNTLADALLAMDSRMPSSSAEGREIAKKALRRDRRRVRILTWATSGFFLLTVIGICGSVYWYYLKVMPVMNHLERDVIPLIPQIHNLEGGPSKLSPQTNLAISSAIGCNILYKIQLANLGGTMALFAVMLAAAFCTVLLIMASRRATLGQIQASLLVLSEQFDSLQRSLQGGHSTGGGQATQEPGA
jgi:hypothetical protein